MKAEEELGSPRDADIPRLLDERGWRQGTVFRASGVELWRMVADTTSDDDRVVARPLPIPTDGRFVVVSQTCDIVAAIHKEPVVEAFPCAVESDASKRASYRRSFRWFEIDRQVGLIAHAMYRIALDKRTLLSLTPEPWPATVERLRQFRRWLGRRSSRSAIPDSIVDAFVKPLFEVTKQIEKRYPDEYRAFNNAVTDIFIKLPATETPPFVIELILLLDEAGLSSEADDAINRVCRELQRGLAPDRATLAAVQTRSRERMSVADYFELALIDFDMLSYEGDELIGASPIPLP